MKALIGLVLLAGCSSLLPMTGDLKSDTPDSDIKRIASVTHLTEDQVRDTTIHEVHEVRLSFLQMLDECYVGVPLFWKLLGAVPLACTQIIQQPWNEKVAMIYYWPPASYFTLDHEREHAKGKTHAYW
jgi:hypothetical protein